MLPDVELGSGNFCRYNSLEKGLLRERTNLTKGPPGARVCSLSATGSDMLEVDLTHS